MTKTKNSRRLTVVQLAIAAALSLAVAAGLSACENVAGYTQPSLVRVIDASYVAPAVNVTAGGVAVASNIGQGTVTPYTTVPAAATATIKVTAATGGSTLVQTSATLTGGTQHSVFLTDNGASSTSYDVVVITDPQITAAAGHTALRVLNQAPKTGPIDVYVVPDSTELSNTLVYFQAVPVGQTAGYKSFTSQTITLVITPTGVTTSKYTSASLALTGGEVYTVLVYDSQLTSDPPVGMLLVNDLSQ